MNYMQAAEYRQRSVTKAALGIMVSLAVISGSRALWAQTSLWQDHNPYISAVRSGDILEILVDENLVTDVDSKWERSDKLELKLYPDTKNLPFLNSSEQSRADNRNNKVRYKLKDGLSFRIAGIVGEARNDGRVYTLQATRNVRVDGKPAQVQLSALFDPRQVKNRTVRSSQLAELAIVIVSEPPVVRNTTINLKPPRNPADTTPPQPVSTAELSEQEKQQILLRHLQQILGGLNP